MPYDPVTNSVPAAPGAIVILFILFSIVFLIVLVARRSSRSWRDPRLSSPAPRFLPLECNTVEFGGRRYSMRLVDYQTKDWLKGLASARFWTRYEAVGKPRLVSLRPGFRWIIGARPIGGLVSCLLESDRELRKIAIWLLGRCGRGVRIPALRVLLHNTDPELRRHVARALQRTGDWNELQSLAMRDPAPRVRTAAQLLSTGGRRAYSERLGRFVGHTRGELYEPGPFSSHMPLWLPSPVGPGKPAKTRDWIRRILEHIQKLVRSSTHDRAA